MPYTVSSAFVDAISAKHVGNLRRRFIVGSTDYSDYVVKWPKFKRSWNDVKPGDLQIKLNNAEKVFNFFREDTTTLRATCAVQVGIGSEYITLFSGQSNRVLYSDEALTLNITDKFKQLAERIAGTDENPVDYTGSSYFVHDLIWYLCTSHGGLSAVASTSNADIDYASWSDLAAVFSADSVRAKAYFKGRKVNEYLRDIADLTETSIYIKNNRISFHRFNLMDEALIEFTQDEQFEFELEVRDSDIINKQWVFFDYSVASDYFTKAAYSQATDSVNSYGRREEATKNKNVWYVTSASALNLAQRKTRAYKYPFDRVSVKVPLVGAIYQVGDSCVVTDNHLEMSNNFRIMSSEVDLHEGTARFEVDQSQAASGFRLDSSALDGSDVLS